MSNVNRHSAIMCLSNVITSTEFFFPSSSFLCFSHLLPRNRILVWEKRAHLYRQRHYRSVRSSLGHAMQRRRTYQVGCVPWYQQSKLLVSTCGPWHLVKKSKKLPRHLNRRNLHVCECMCVPWISGSFSPATIRFWSCLAWKSRSCESPPLRCAGVSERRLLAVMP